MINEEIDVVSVIVSYITRDTQAGVKTLKVQIKVFRYNIIYLLPLVNLQRFNG